MKEIILQNNEEITGLLDQAITINRRNQMRAELQKAGYGQAVPPIVQNTIDYSQAEIERLGRMKENMANGKGTSASNGEQFAGLSAQVSSMRADFVERVGVMQDEIGVLGQKVDGLGDGLAKNIRASAANTARLSGLITTVSSIVEATAESQRSLLNALTEVSPILEEVEGE